MLRTSIRQRRLLRRMLGYLVEPVRAQWRVLLSRDQHHVIGGHPVVLPPGHLLPWFQRRDPTYDRYAEPLISRLCAGRAVTVVDLGANVGDSAVAILSSDPDVRVVSVEGSPEFLTYLRRNVAAFGGRVEVLEAFVGPVVTASSYVSHGTSGAFVGPAGGEATTEGSEVPWVTPADILARIPPDREVLWKSDIDGYDIHVLVQGWDVIASRCSVLWFEFDPAHTLGDRDDVRGLIELLAGSGRHLIVHDNLGRRMLTTSGPDAIRDVLTGLTSWLDEQVQGHTAVQYLDLWALEPEGMARL